jgi:hypothetical protein
MRIAKIVKSNSHVDYVGRVIDRLDAESSPSEDDYGFAQFVGMPVSEREEIVGVVYDTQLANPEYGNYGPRLSPRLEQAVLSPDYLNEQGVLLGILLLGWRERVGDKAHWASHHEVPRRVIPVGQDIYRLANDDLASFHRTRGEAVQIAYYSRVMAHAGPFAVPLVEAIIGQLEPLSSPTERQRLSVLKKSLSWQRALGAERL